MEGHLNVIKMQLPISIKIMLRQRFFREKWVEKIGEAEEIRHASDYDDFYIASKEESERQIAVAGEFIELVEKYCMEQNTQ